VLDDSSITDTVRTVANVQIGMWYFWRVRGANDGGIGGWSDVWRCRPILARPDSVRLVAPAPNAIVPGDSVRCVWRRSGPEVARYRVELSNDSLFSHHYVDSTLIDTAATVWQLSNLISYWWRVSVQNEAGWGPSSIPRSFRVVITGLPSQALPPRSFSLEQNYPNPFNPTTSIRFSLPYTTHVTLRVVDVLGKEVARLVDERRDAGTYAIVWNPTHLSSGVYLYQLRAGPFVRTRKLIFLQ